MHQAKERTELEAVESTAAIMKHPIHPMLIPFPIAFLTGAFLTDVGYWLTSDPFWARASMWLIGAGIVSGLLAGLVGAIDFFTLERPRSYTGGWIHAIGNVTALGLSLVNLIIRWNDPEGAIMWVGMILSLIVLGMLTVTGWFGGEMSYRYKIGVVEQDH